MTAQIIDFALHKVRRQMRDNPVPPEPATLTYYHQCVECDHEPEIPDEDVYVCDDSGRDFVECPRCHNEMPLNDLG